MNYKPSKQALGKFNYFASCQDAKRLTAIPMDESGYTAAICFCYHETHGGKLLPCREPELLAKALNGKEWHGLTVTMCAEDYVGRLLFASELKERYPEWVRRDILGRAGQIAIQQLGYVPTFVATGEGFTTLPESEFPKIEINIYA